MKYFLTIFILFFILFIKADIVYGNRILLSDVEEITFYKDSLTTGYRTTPIPQIINLDNHYNNVIPSTVTCRNLGGLGNDIQWECSAVLNDNYYFSHQNVNCEGYHYSGDPYKLEGSCSFEYRLKLINEFNGEFNGDFNSGFDSSFSSDISSGIGDFLSFSVILMCLVLFPSLGLLFMVISSLSNIFCRSRPYYYNYGDYGSSNVYRGYNRSGGIGNMGNYGRWGINRSYPNYGNYRNYSGNGGSRFKIKRGVATSYGR